MLALLLPSHVIVCLHSTMAPVQVSTIFKSNSSLHMTDIAIDNAGNVLFVSGEDNSVCQLTRGYAVLLAGCGIAGTTDGVGSHACFNSPYGIAYDAVRSIAYISDNGNHRIRKLDLNNNNRNNVTTFAGAGSGSTDGAGTAALFSAPTGIVYHPRLADGVLYIADEGNCRVRRIIISNASVTTLAIPGGGSGVNPCYYLCITSNGQYLYVTTQNNTAASISYTIVQISTTSGAVVPIAGGPTGTLNGVGFAARFNYFRGIALNSDESALIIADYWNNLIRRMDLSSKQVSTIAGVTAAGSADGPGSTATFSGPEGAVWYCNASSPQCGFLVGEYGNIDLRFVAMERYTATLSPSMMARSETESRNSSATMSMTSSRTLSVSVSMNTASPTMTTSPSVGTSAPSLTVTTSASSSSTLSTTCSPSTTSSRSMHTRSSTTSWSFRHTNSSVSSSLSTSTTATITATLSFVHTYTTTLSSTPSRSTSTTQSRMRFTATTSMSYSRSATGALSTLSHTCTRHTDSPTSTVFCALIYGPSELTAFTSSSSTSSSSSNLSSSASVAVVLAMQSAGDETNVEEGTPIVASPLSRDAVLSNPALALNLSLTLANSSTSTIIISGDHDEGDAWVLDSVVLDVLPTSSSFPLLTTNVPFTTVRSTHLVAVNDHRQQFVACVLQPPNASTSASRSVDVRVPHTGSLGVIICCASTPCACATRQTWRHHNNNAWASCGFPSSGVEGADLRSSSTVGGKSRFVAPTHSKSPWR
ncbi:transmembrane protein, putative [Bodo saltans]|uniref:Transmembrane protein, putative n=1 Tax=Bodo saltans TaxID=75058 RepID=A0A0S4KNM6_BODSA|nr:transmembrane protein, putative [Bodo saltans]|eukprot:CUI14492.1 transmembrane protein, putative [Bodo saltans]